MPQKNGDSKSGSLTQPKLKPKREPDYVMNSTRSNKIMQRQFGKNAKIVKKTKENLRNWKCLINTNQPGNEPYTSEVLVGFMRKDPLIVPPDHQRVSDDPDGDKTNFNSQPPATQNNTTTPELLSANTQGIVTDKNPELEKLVDEVIAQIIARNNKLQPKAETENNNTNKQIQAYGDPILHQRPTFDQSKYGIPYPHCSYEQNLSYNEGFGRQPRLCGEAYFMQPNSPSNFWNPKYHSEQFKQTQISYQNPTYWNNYQSLNGENFMPEQLTQTELQVATAYNRSTRRKRSPNADPKRAN